MKDNLLNIAILRDSIPVTVTLRKNERASFSAVREEASLIEKAWHIR